MSDINPPWNISPDEKGGRALICSQKSGDPVAIVDSAHVSSKRARVNIARLLSAAPELAKTAEWVIEQHDKNAAPYGPCLCEECIRLKAALEKAEGIRFRSLEGKRP